MDNVEYLSLSLSLINCFGLMSFSISNGGGSKPKEKKRKENQIVVVERNYELSFLAWGWGYKLTKREASSMKGISNDR